MYLKSCSKFINPNNPFKMCLVKGLCWEAEHRHKKAEEIKEKAELRNVYKKKTLGKNYPYLDSSFWESKYNSKNIIFLEEGVGVLYSVCYLDNG